jgi:hypothetical protein
VQGVRQLKIYKAGKFAKQPGVNFIGYNPNSACGGTNINIQNYATAALYNYTPYQPNAAALGAEVTPSMNPTGSFTLLPPCVDPNQLV